MQFWLCLIDILFFLNLLLFFETYRLTATNISPGDLSTSRVLLILKLKSAGKIGEHILIHCWTEHRLLRALNPLTEICNDIFLNMCVPFPFQNKDKLEVFTYINKPFGTLFILWWGQGNTTSTTSTRAVVQVKWEVEIW